MSPVTPNRGLYQPVAGDDGWDDEINSNFATIDAFPAGHQILNSSGSVMPTRSKLKFSGGALSVSDQASTGGGTTVVTVTSSGGTQPDGAVMWARLAQSTNSGGTTLPLDRDGGLLDVLPESRLFIGVGSQTFDYKAVTPAAVNGTQVTVSAMLSAHAAGDVVAILAPGQGVPMTWMGVGVDTSLAGATANVTAVNRFTQYGGAADLAGGATLLVDGGLLCNGMVKIRGDKVPVIGLGGSIRGEGFQCHTSMTFPSDGSSQLISIQDASGNTPTWANPVGAVDSIIENIFLYGNRASDSLGLVHVPQGSSADGLSVRDFIGHGGWCALGGKGYDISNFQADYNTAHLVISTDSWTVKNMACTATTVVDGATHYHARILGGTGGAIIGGDLENQTVPGCFVSIEGTASGILLDTLWSSSLDGSPSAGTIINVDSGAGVGVGSSCAYRVNGYWLNNDPSPPNWKFLRDVQRNFHLVRGDIYSRWLWAETMSSTQVVYNNTTVASASTPRAAGNIGT